MSDKIVSAIITASATLFSAIILGLIAKLITKRISKIKEVNRKLIDDWEYLYKIEEVLLNEIHEANGIPVHSKKIEARKIVSKKLGRSLNMRGLAYIQKLQKFKKWNEYVFKMQKRMRENFFCTLYLLNALYG